MCKCNQGGYRLRIAVNPRVAAVRKLLVRARLLKQEYEVVKDFLDNGGPRHLKEKSDKLWTDAAFVRGSVQGILRQMERGAGRAFMNGRPHLGSKANLIQGSNFKNWPEYRNTFSETRRGKTDIWL